VDTAMQATTAMIVIAALDFNARNGATLPSFAALSDCPVTLNLTLYDDESLPRTGMQQFMVSAAAPAGLDAVTGLYFSSVALPVVTAASALDVPVVSSWSMSDDLADPSTYPYFSRTIPSNGAEGVATAALLAAMGYTRVACLYQSEPYSTDWSDDLLEAGAAVGVSVTLFAWDDVTGDALRVSIDSAVARAAAAKFNVVVFVFSATGSMEYLAVSALANGMLATDKLWISTYGVFFDVSEPPTPAAAAASANDSAVLQLYAGSLFVESGPPGFQNAVPNPVLDAFSANYARFNASLVNAYLPRYDLFGSSFLLPPTYFAQTDPVALGSSLLYAYDAVAALGIAACSAQALAALSAAPASSTSQNMGARGAALMSAILATEFAGVSGPVRFLADGNRDPRSQVHSAMLMYVNATTGAVQYSQYALFTPENGSWVINAEAAALGAAVFRSGAYDPPPDTTVPNENMNLVPLGVQALGYAEACVVFAVLVYAEVLIARHAEHAELVTSQPIFVSFIDAGVALVGAAIVSLTTQSSGGSCMAFAFTLGLGVTTVATSIAARSLRVAVLWRRTNFQRNTRDRGERYLAVILVPLVVQALVMAGWQLDAPLVFERVVTATDVLGNPTSSYGVCAVTGPRSAAYLGVSVGLVALWVALTVATAVAVRRAPEEFHDAPRLVLVAALLAQIYFFSIPLAAAVYSIPVAL